jgi:Rieske Fe-S protein
MHRSLEVEPCDKGNTRMNRRDFHRVGTIVIGNAVALALAVPGIRYLLDPLGKSSKQGGFLTLARLEDLKVGEPRSFAVIDERRDAWVKYPREPIGSVWLVRQPAGVKPEVVAFTAECPHLGCAVSLTPDGASFLCPCHTSAFDKSGKRLNDVPPRGMDTLEVELTEGGDPAIRVRFQRFRTQEKEKRPLA